MDLHHFIQPVGITTLASLIRTIILALIRKRKPRLLFRWHWIQAFMTLGLAVVHFFLVFFSD
jgi:drug/metabolite transporter (DMT)-like permease